jgi:hypothetical protein
VGNNSPTMGNNSSSIQQTAMEIQHASLYLESWAITKKIFLTLTRKKCLLSSRAVSYGAAASEGEVLIRGDDLPFNSFLC